MMAAELKLDLLISGVSIQFKSLSGLSYKSDKHLHNDRHFTSLEFASKVPQELLITDKDGMSLCVGVLSRPESPYSLQAKGDDVWLSHFGKRIPVEVKLVSEPLFWNFETSDGIPSYALVSVPGLNELNLWTWHDCSFQHANLGCLFCATSKTAELYGTGYNSGLLTARAIQQMHKVKDSFDDEYKKLLQRATESMQMALTYDFNHQDYWFTLISGALPHDLLSFQYEVFAKLITDLLYNCPEIRRDRIVCNAMPPYEINSLYLLKEAGVTHYMANLEIWNNGQLKKICPGKWDFGKDRFLNALTSAVDIFGPGHVWCNFVLGIEPLDQLLEGFSYLAQQGIVPGANVFHKDPSVQLDFYPDISLEDFRLFFIKAGEILKKNHLEPIYCKESRRSSLLWEAFLEIL